MTYWSTIELLFAAALTAGGSFAVSVAGVRELATPFLGIAVGMSLVGIGGYRVLAYKSGVTLAFCWAHVRRRFYELAAAGPAPIASVALTRTAELYKIEDSIHGSADEQHRLRQEKSRPVFEALEPWLREKLLDQPEDQVCRGDPLRPLALAMPHAIPQ